MNRNLPSSHLNRREFLAASALGTGWALAGAPTARGEGNENSEVSKIPFGKAEHCIFLWLGGGACHVDTWDPKRLGDARARKAGSYYPSIPTAIPGASVCEHLQRSAKILDRAALLRAVHHDVIDEHAAAVNRMHTGRTTSGTVVYPSIGSVVAHELGAAGKSVPPYIIMGYPNLTRGPGFLGAKHGYVYLTDTESGPRGLSRHPSISAGRQKRREELLSRVRKANQKKSRDPSIADYSDVGTSAFEMAGPEFMSAFELKKEPADLRLAYGAEFGQRCLLARRLVERGVRFVEVAHNLNFINGTGWDTHNEGQKNQHLLIEELDRAFSTLVLDLERKKMLEKTLIVIATEFGRPPEFDGRGGRGHYSKAFSIVLAGGGLRTGQIIGETDELGKKIVTGSVSVPDLFATAYHALKIDPQKVLYAGERPVPITDGGRPIAELFA